jgi:hypothetical protein
MYIRYSHSYTKKGFSFIHGPLRKENSTLKVLECDHVLPLQDVSSATMHDNAAASTDDGVDERHGTRTSNLHHWWDKTPATLGCEPDEDCKMRKLDEALNPSLVLRFASLTSVRFAPTAKPIAILSI